jgi:RNA polymerase sigma-70 factor, ECF subfamily
MSKEEHRNLFSDLLARYQSDLYSYIFAVVRNWDDTDDLLQSVCLVLWRKFDSFAPGSNFLFWASRIAKIEVSNFLRRRPLPGRANDELLDAFVETVVHVRNEDKEPYLAALRHCREKLNAADEELIAFHYVEDLGSREIAERLHRSQSSVCNSLSRIRSWLFECIQTELARQERSGRGLP